MARASTRKPANGRGYPEDFKLKALELAATIGQRATSRQLDVSLGALRRWIDEHQDHWISLKEGAEEAQQLGLARRLDDLAEGYVAMEAAALERAEKLIATADAKETAALIKAMGSSRGLATVNARAARGQDADRHEVNINFPQIEQALEKILSTAAPQPALPTPNLAEVEDDDA